MAPQIDEIAPPLEEIAHGVLRFHRFQNDRLHVDERIFLDRAVVVMLRLPLRLHQAWGYDQARTASDGEAIAQTLAELPALLREIAIRLNATDAPPTWQVVELVGELMGIVIALENGESKGGKAVAKAFKQLRKHYRAHLSMESGS